VIIQNAIFPETVFPKPESNELLHEALLQFCKEEQKTKLHAAKAILET